MTVSGLANNSLMYSCSLNCLIIFNTFQIPFDIMEMTKNRQSDIETGMNNEVTSNSEGEKKLDHKPVVNLGLHLSELIHITQLSNLLLLQLKISHQTNFLFTEDLNEEIILYLFNIWNNL